MTTMTARHVDGEELMAFVDGELTGPALRTVEQHIASCEVCAAEVATLQNEARTLKAWNVPEFPYHIEGHVNAKLKDWTTQPVSPKRWITALRPSWQLWCGGALTASALALLVIATTQAPSSPPTQAAVHDEGPVDSYAGDAKQSPQPAMAVDRLRAYDKAVSPGTAGESVAAGDILPPPAMAARKMMPAPPAVPRSSVAAPRAQRFTAGNLDATAPMIARTVALTLIVKDVERSRLGLEELLRTYNGYAAQMDVSTPESGKRTLHASLRIPAGQMRGLLAELKGYGKVANETQSGEEVGQQHADLVARLNTARESEERLRSILKNRTGDVADVLQVEEEIARVRADIETMEAEQQGLEHRVSYATVDLQMSEEGQGPAGPAGPAVSTRLAAAARQGWENATDTVLGFITFLLQYGLAVAFIIALTGIPAWLAVKWWRKLHPNS